MHNPSGLSRAKARKFYDKFGAKQDSQAYYEDVALDILFKHADFSSALAVFEFGCGTGRFAVKLLEQYLPENATYLGCDISTTMINLTHGRLSKYAGRAKIQQITEISELTLQDESYDRFVSNYVFDLLAYSEMTEVLNEARRILKPGGLLCLSGITPGHTPFSKLVMGAWTIINKVWPALLGGCRPVKLSHHIKEDYWQIIHEAKVSAYGISSEVMIAKKK